MMIKIIFLGYLRSLNQADLAFSRRILDEANLTNADLEQASRTGPREGVGCTPRVCGGP